MASIAGLDWNSPTTQLLAIGLVGGAIYWFYYRSKTQGVAVANAKKEVSMATNAESYRMGMKDLAHATANTYPYIPISSSLLDH